jgi:hypothetical protein
MLDEVKPIPRDIEVAAIRSRQMDIIDTQQAKRTRFGGEIPAVPVSWGRRFHAIPA